MRASRLVLFVVTVLLLLRTVPAHSSNGIVDVSALAIDPLNPTTLYAGMWGGGGVFKSTDGGANWRAIGLTNIAVGALAIDPLTPTTLYAGGDGVFKSTDGGANWNVILTDVSVSALAIDPLTPTTLYAGTLSDSVFKSTDGGASWSSTLLHSPFASCSPCGGVRTLAIDPLTPTTLFVGTDYATEWLDDGTFLFYPGGVFKSTDGGANWGAVLYSYAWGFRALAIAPVTPTTLYAVDYGFGLIYRSTDGGASWNCSSPGADIFVISLAIDPLTPTTLYAGGGSDYGWGGAVFKSTDGGIHWTEAFPAFSRGSCCFRPLVVDPVTPTTLYGDEWIGLRRRRI